MADTTPRLPSNLPAKFGNDSPFPPPAVSPLNASAAFLSSASAPPLPPTRDEALERERQLRQMGYNHAAAGPSSFGGSLQPGQIIPSTAMLYTRPVAASRHFRAPPPVPAHASSRSPRPPPKQPIQQRSRAQQNPSSSSTQRPQNSERKARTKDIPAKPSVASSSMQRTDPRANPQRRKNSNKDETRQLAPQQQQLQQPREVRQQDRVIEYRPPVRDTASPAPIPELNVVLPNMNDLGTSRERALASGNDKRVAAWCKDVIKYVERKSEGTKISDPLLVQYIDEAINSINRLASSSPPLAEALYLRGDLLASGAFPAYHRKSLKEAFSDFELSARMGHAPSWFRIGRDYEILGDNVRARDAYERGRAVRDVGCIYRMGMANLLGQLGLPMNHERAIPLLREAADLVNLDTPQPSYIYGMLLAGEFSHVEVNPRLLVPNPPATIESEAKKRIQRAAYLNFGPAQYRCGWSYEYALLDCPFDPLLSVQYYSLASQAGEVEADLALSKWFLCGAEGCFDKNEGLAFIFAEKAARKGLPSAEFAMGYYFEVGVGCQKSIEVAQKWYHIAASHGNTDAKERLVALQGPSPSSLSRTQHEVHVDTQLQRKRTEAKVKSDRKSKIIAKQRRPERNEDSRGAAASNRPIDVRRRMTMLLVEETAAKKGSHPRRDDQISTQNDFTGERERRPAPDIAINRSAGNRDKIGRPAVSASASGHSTPSSKPSQATTTRPGASNGNRPPKQSSTAASNSASDYSQDKKFETFGEMGFSAKKTKDDKDCVIC